MKFPASEKYYCQIRLDVPLGLYQQTLLKGGHERLPQLFKKHLTYAIGSVEETKCWLEYSLQCNYIEKKEFYKLIEVSEELGAKLFLFRKAI